MMGLRGDHRSRLVIMLWGSWSVGGNTCEQPRLSPAEGEGVLECQNDAQHEHEIGTQPQTQQQQEEEDGPEARPRY